MLHKFTGNWYLDIRNQAFTLLTGHRAEGGSAEVLFSTATEKQI